MLSYRGYTASLEIDVDAKTLHGRVIGIYDVVTFAGKTIEESESEFHKSIDAYLGFCEQLNKKPNQPLEVGSFSGEVPFHTTPEVHRAIYLAAKRTGKSINSWIEDTLKDLPDLAPN